MDLAAVRAKVVTRLTTDGTVVGRQTRQQFDEAKRVMRPLTECFQMARVDERRVEPRMRDPMVEVRRRCCQAHGMETLAPWIDPGRSTGLSDRGCEKRRLMDADV